MCNTIQVDKGWKLSSVTCMSIDLSELAWMTIQAQSNQSNRISSGNQYFTHATQNLTEQIRMEICSAGVVHQHGPLIPLILSAVCCRTTCSSPLAGGALRCTQTACSETASGLKTHCTPPRCRFLHKNKFSDDRDGIASLQNSATLSHSTFTTASDEQ